MKKYVIYTDQDGVLANFIGSIPNGHLLTHDSEPSEMYEKGFYRNLKVNDGALEAIDKILSSNKIDLYVASKPAVKNPYCASEKYEWLQEHFPPLFKKTFLTCDKTLLRGDMLIDDHPTRWKNFEGIVFPFNHLEPRESWAKVIDLLRNMELL